MIGLLGIEDRDAHRHRIEKGRIGELHASPLLILLDVEQQFVAADRHGVGVHQWSLLVDTAVFVRRHGLEQFPDIAVLAGKVDAQPAAFLPRYVSRACVLSLAGLACALTARRSNLSVMIASITPPHCGALCGLGSALAVEDLLEILPGVARSVGGDPRVRLTPQPVPRSWPCHLAGGRRPA